MVRDQLPLLPQQPSQLPHHRTSATSKCISAGACLPFRRLRSRGTLSRFPLMNALRLLWVRSLAQGLKILRLANLPKSPIKNLIKEFYYFSTNKICIFVCNTSSCYMPPERRNNSKFNTWNKFCFLC